MKSPKRLLSSTLCRGQRVPKGLSNPSMKMSRSTPQPSAMGLHTGPLGRVKDAMGELKSSQVAALRQASPLGLAFNFRPESSLRREPPRAFSTRQSRETMDLMSKRLLHSSAVSNHGEIKRPTPGEGITVHFHDSHNKLIKTIEGNEGDSLLDLAHEHDIDMEGACEGSVACSTCHVILTPEHYDMLEEPEDDENDMLDMAFGLTDTSRLGCQVKLKKELDGMVVTLPSATRNFFVDGAKPTKH